MLPLTLVIGSEMYAAPLRRKCNVVALSGGAIWATIVAETG